MKQTRPMRRGPPDRPLKQFPEGADVVIEAPLACVEETRKNIAFVMKYLCRQLICVLFSICAVPAWTQTPAWKDQGIVHTGNSPTPKLHPTERYFAFLDHSQLRRVLADGLRDAYDAFPVANSRSFSLAVRKLIKAEHRLALRRKTAQRQQKDLVYLRGPIGAGLLAHALRRELSLRDDEIVVHRQQCLRRDGRPVAPVASIDQIWHAIGLEQGIPDSAFREDVNAAPPRGRIVIRFAGPGAVGTSLKDIRRKYTCARSNDSRDRSPGRPCCCCSPSGISASSS
jgi:hypothetical protein